MKRKPGSEGTISQFKNDDILYTGRGRPIKAKSAKTDCCDARPVKWSPKQAETYKWWAICGECSSAIKGDLNMGGMNL